MLLFFVSEVSDAILYKSNLRTEIFPPKWEWWMLVLFIKAFLYPSLDENKSTGDLRHDM